MAGFVNMFVDSFQEGFYVGTWVLLGSGSIQQLNSCVFVSGRELHATCDLPASQKAY